MLNIKQKHWSISTTHTCSVFTAAWTLSLNSIFLLIYQYIWLVKIAIATVHPSTVVSAATLPPYNYVCTYQSDRPSGKKCCQLYAYSNEFPWKTYIMYFINMPKIDVKILNSGQHFCGNPFGLCSVHLFFDRFVVNTAQTFHKSASFTVFAATNYIVITIAIYWIGRHILGTPILYYLQGSTAYKSLATTYIGGMMWLKPKYAVSINIDSMTTIFVIRTVPNMLCFCDNVRSYRTCVHIVINWSHYQRIPKLSTTNIQNSSELLGSFYSFAFITVVMNDGRKCIKCQ